MQRLARIALVFLVAFGLFAISSRARAEGALLARGPNGEEQGLFPLTRTEVTTEIHGEVITASVKQKFENKFSVKIEAVYVFPLPNDAAVDDLEMKVGDRVIKAEIKKRNDARREYDAARNAGRHAALLEQERPNIFTFSVANIDPGKAIEVNVHYFALAHYDHGTYQMAFPMVVGPRYIPGSPTPAPESGTGTKPDTDRVPDASRISPAYVTPGTRSGHTVGLSVALDAGTDIDSIVSKAHDVAITRQGSTKATIALTDKAEIPNRDFILEWKLTATEARPAVFAHRPAADKDGYLALMIEPRHDAPATEIAPREIFFLLDTSGSMSGPPIETAIAAARRALATLNPSDSFQIIDFADSASSFAKDPLPNTPENVKRANEYLSHLNASGGTNQLVGIHAALSAPGDSQRLRYVVFMTDGFIGNEGEVIGLVQKEIGSARIFGFGIGGSVNRYLLDEVSLAGRGYAEYLRPHEDASAIVERFYKRIGRPYLTDISIDWGGLGVTDVQPAKVPDLSTFEPLLVLGRYHGSGPATIEVKGRVGMKPFSRKINVDMPNQTEKGSALARLWARAKIENLSRREHAEGETADIVGAITNLALEHHLVTKYTSLIAVDYKQLPSANGGPPALIPQPGEAPAGVDLGMAGGMVETIEQDAPPGMPGAMGYGDTGAKAEEMVVVGRAPSGCSGCATSESPFDTRSVIILALGGAALVMRRRRR